MTKKLTKRQAIKLFQKLFEPSAIKYSHWRDFIECLYKDENITKGQFNKWDGSKHTWEQAQKVA